MTLTPAQERVLVFLGKHAANRWVSLVEMDQIRLLEADDVLTIPSLIEQKLLLYLEAIRAVTLTAAGTTLADEIRSAQFLADRNKQTTIAGYTNMTIAELRALAEAATPDIWSGCQAVLFGPKRVADKAFLATISPDLI